MAQKRAAALKKQEEDSEDEAEVDDDEESAEMADDDEDGEEDDDEAEDEDADEDEEEEEDEDIKARAKIRASYGAEDLGGNLELDNDMMIASDIDSDEIDEVDDEPTITTPAANIQKKQKKIEKVVFEIDESDPNPVPFNFPAPNSYKDFRALLQARGEDTPKSVADHELIITRIRTLYNTKVDKGNVSVMETLYKCMYRHMRVVCEEESVRVAAIEEKRNPKTFGLNDEKNTTSVSSSDLALAKLDVVCRQVFELNEMMLKFSSRTSRDFVHALRNAMQERIAGLSTEKAMGKLYNAQSASSYPAPHELMGLRMLSKMYPITDYRHTITTPIYILLGEILSSFPVRGGRDMVTGLFICSMLLEFTSETKRFIPEIVSYLQSVLVALFDLSSIKNASIVNDTELAPKTDKDLTYLLSNKIRTFLPQVNSLCKMYDVTCAPTAFTYIDQFNKAASAVNGPAAAQKTAAHVETAPTFDKLPLGLMFLPHNNFAVFKSPAFASAILSTVSKLTFAAAQTYFKLESFPEIFSPLYSAFAVVVERQKFAADQEVPESFTSVPANASVVTKFRALMHQLKQQAKRITNQRKPLARFARPMAIREYNPSFIDDYVPGKDMEMSKEKAEEKRKKEKAKRANKAAIREVRRDQQFIMLEKAKTQQKATARKEVERKRVWAEVAREAEDTHALDQVGKKRRK